jgi:hypothetical protein
MQGLLSAWVLVAEVLILELYGAECAAAVARAAVADSAQAQLLLHSCTRVNTCICCEMLTTTPHGCALLLFSAATCGVSMRTELDSQGAYRLKLLGLTEIVIVQDADTCPALDGLTNGRGSEARDESKRTAQQRPHRHITTATAMGTP